MSLALNTFDYRATKAIGRYRSDFHQRLWMIVIAEWKEHIKSGVPQDVAFRRAIHMMHTSAQTGCNIYIYPGAIDSMRSRM